MEWTHTLLFYIPACPFTTSLEMIQHRLRETGISQDRQTLAAALEELAHQFPIHQDPQTQEWQWRGEMDLPTALMYRMWEAVVLSQRHMLPPSLRSGLQPYFEKAEATLAAFPEYPWSAWADKVRMVNEFPFQPPDTSQVMDQVLEMLLNDQQFFVTYSSPHRDKPKRYSLHPLGLVYKDVKPYLVSTIYKFESLTTLPIYRMSEISPLNKKRQIPPGYQDIDTFIQKGGFRWGSQEPMSLKLEVRPYVVQYLREMPFSEDQIIEDSGNGWFTLTATVPDTWNLTTAILEIGDYVKVIEPKQLLDRVRRIISNSARQYQQDFLAALDEAADLFRDIAEFETLTETIASFSTQVFPITSCVVLDESRCAVSSIPDPCKTWMKSVESELEYLEIPEGEILHHQDYEVESGKTISVTYLSLESGKNHSGYLLFFHQEGLKLLAEYQDQLEFYAKFIGTHLENAIISNQFQKFVPPKLTWLIKRQEGKFPTTILFSDVRNFTQMSESMTPDEVYEFVNTYLGLMTQPIEAHDGIVDKYIGDAIMALFVDEKQDPIEAANHAFQAALGMQEALNDYNRQRKQDGRAPVGMGIGIHSGEAFLGTVGSAGRMSSTALGDAVNFASRLESMTKYYHCNMIISSQTYRLLEQPKVLWRELDFVRAKGKSKPESILEIFNGDAEPLRSRKQEILSPYHQGLMYYFAQDWPAALQFFDQCLSSFPDDTVSKMYIKRCQDYLQSPPGEDWDRTFGPVTSIFSS